MCSTGWLDLWLLGSIVTELGVVAVSNRDVRTHSDGFTAEGLKSYRGDARGDEMYQ